MHIKKLDNNKVGENMNLEPNTPHPNSCLTHVNHKNNMTCPPPGSICLK